ncbi:MAG: ABC transporter permease [Limisphaerales bacterium]
MPKRLLDRMLHSRELVLFGVLCLMFTGFALTTEYFLNLDALLSQSRYWVAPGMLAVPMTFVIATAGIDLSVGSIVGMCGIVLGILYRDYHWPIAGAAAAAVLSGTAAGALNGGVSSVLRIPPLVVTLATMTLFRGVAFGLSKADAISHFPSAISWLGNGALFIFYFRGETVVVPATLLGLVLVGIAGVMLLRYSWVGRYSLAVGENAVAASFAAIPVRWLLFGIYTATGFVCGVASLFYTAVFATARADGGVGLELEAIAAVVIGGTRISGGQASVTGTLLGLLIISILRYGLDLSGVKSQYVVIIVGVLLVVTAVFNEWMARRAGTKKQ